MTFLYSSLSLSPLLLPFLMRNENNGFYLIIVFARGVLYDNNLNRCYVITLTGCLMTMSSLQNVNECVFGTCSSNLLMKSSLLMLCVRVNSKGSMSIIRRERMFRSMLISRCFTYYLRMLRVIPIPRCARHVSIMRQSDTLVFNPRRKLINVAYFRQ